MAGPTLDTLGQFVAAQAMRDLSDAQLLRRFVSRRDADAFAALARRHGPLVWRTCRHLLRHEQDAEDAFQATFLLLARKAATIREGEAVGGFLHGVARRVALHAKRKAARRRECEQRAGVPEAREPDVGWRELQAILDEEVGRLPEKYRAAFVACCLEGRSRREAAAELACNEGTVSSRVAEARRLLRARLARRGVALSAALTASELWRHSVHAGLPAEIGRCALAVALGHEVASPVVITLAQGAAVRAWSVVATLLAGLSAAALAGGYLASAPPVEVKPKVAEERPAVDAVGDPLPPGAVARLGTVRLRPGDQLTGLRFSPGGQRLVTYGDECGFHVWDVATGRALASRPNPRTPPYPHAYFSRDGRSVITAEWGKKGCVLRRFALPGFQAQGEFETGFRRHIDRVLGPSPDARLVAGSVEGRGRESSVEIWDVEEGKRLRTWKAHTGDIPCHAFSADGKTLVTGGRDKAIRGWDVATGRKTFEFAGLPHLPQHLDLSADGGTLASACIRDRENRAVKPSPSDRQVDLWDVPGRKKLRQLEVPAGPRDLPHGDFALRFLPDGKTLLTAGRDWLVRFWDVKEGRQLRQFPFPTGGVGAYDLSPDGKTLALDRISGAIQLFDLATGQEAVKLPGQLYSVFVPVLTPDGKTAVTHGRGLVTVWDLPTGRVRGMVGEPDSGFDSTHLLPDGRTILCSEGDSLRWFDLTTRKETRRLPLEKAYDRIIALSPDGKTAALRKGAADPPVLFDLTAGREVGALRHDGAWMRDVEVGRIRFGSDSPQAWCRGAAFAPDGRTLLTWTGDQWKGEHAVHVWDVKTCKHLRKILLAAPPFGADPRPAGSYRGAPQHAAALSPTGRLLAFATGWGYLALQEVTTGQAVHVVGGLTDFPRCLAFTPDGRMLAWAGDRDPAIHLVEAVSGKERLRFEGHGGAVYSLRFSADGRALVSGSADTTALVWDVVGRGVPDGGLEGCWAGLADADAAKAFASVRRLLRSPAEAVRLLGDHLRPAAAMVTEAQLKSLIGDLDSDSYPKREAARQELDRAGEEAAETLREALASPSVEKRRRVQRLLDGLVAAARTPSAERLRQSRALEVLERVGGDEARRVLEKLAAGGQGAWLTREAAESLARRR